MTEQHLKDKIEKLEDEIEELESDLRDANRKLEDTQSEVGDLEAQMNHHDCSEEGARTVAEKIHRQLVYLGKDPLDVLDDLLREHGLIWAKAAA